MVGLCVRNSKTKNSRGNPFATASRFKILRNGVFLVLESFFQGVCRWSIAPWLLKPLSELDPTPNFSRRCRLALEGNQRIGD